MSVLLFITVAAQVFLMSYDIKYFTVKREFSLESLKAKSGSIPYKIYDVFLRITPLLSYNFLFSRYKYGN